MKSYFQIVSKYKIQRYWKMFAKTKNKYKICTFILDQKNDSEMHLRKKHANM